MVPESNCFIFMQTDYSRWPPWAVTKNSIRANNDNISRTIGSRSKMAARGCYQNSIKTKMTISQDPLVEIDPTFCQNVSCMKE